MTRHAMLFARMLIAFAVPMSVPVTSLAESAKQVASWRHALQLGNGKVERARAALEIEAGRWRGQLDQLSIPGNQLETTIVRYVRNNYTRVVDDALLGIIPHAQTSDPEVALSIATTTATWALNSKGIAREILVRGSQMRSGLRSPSESLVPNYVTVDGVLSHLRPDEALVEYLRIQDTIARRTYVVWAITRVGTASGLEPVRMAILGTAQNVEEQVKEAYRGCCSTKKADPWSDLLATRRLLVDEFAESPANANDIPLFRRGVKRWTLSPNADIWLLPFAALPLTDNASKVASQDYVVRYVLSGRHAAFPSTEKRLTGGLSATLLYDPDFGAPQALASRLADRADPNVPSEVGRQPIVLASFQESPLHLVGNHCRRRCQQVPYRVNCPPPRPAPAISPTGDLLVRDLLDAADGSGSGLSTQTAGGIGPKGFVPLPAFKNLGNSVVATWANTPLVARSGAAATEALLRQPQMVNRRLVLIATHGFYCPQNFDFVPRDTGERDQRFANRLRRDPMNPLARCGLAFAGANVRLASGRELIEDSPNDGILLGTELAALNTLRNTELVALFCCQTATGDLVYDGDSLASIRHCCLSAGARFVLATNWEIEAVTGKPTYEITRRVIEGTRAAWSDVRQSQASNATDYAGILSEAQRQHLVDPVTKKPRHPYFWAAFSVTGN